MGAVSSATGVGGAVSSVVGAVSSATGVSSSGSGIITPDKLGAAMVRGRSFFIELSDLASLLFPVSKLIGGRELEGAFPLPNPELAVNSSSIVTSESLSKVSLVSSALSVSSKKENNPPSLVEKALFMPVDLWPKDQKKIAPITLKVTITASHSSSTFRRIPGRELDSDEPSGGVWGDEFVISKDNSYTTLVPT